MGRSRSAKPATGTVFDGRAFIEGSLRLDADDLAENPSLTKCYATPALEKELMSDSERSLPSSKGSDWKWIGIALKEIGSR